VSRSLLNPLTVSAKVVRAETKVPSLGGAVFNRDAVLEKGIHVHWSLPDWLTRATLMPTGGQHSARFPAVPDVWLVIRFNPGPPIEQVNAKRTWRAWVVDSVEAKAVPLSAWVPPARDPKVIHTVAGVLPSGAGARHPGFGLWPKTKTAFDPALAAYYPEARTRFGFYDNVSDLPATGNVSYVIVGWFADRHHDPLYMAKDKLGLLNDWKLSHHLRAGVYAEANTLTPQAGTTATAPSFAASSIAVKDLALAPGKEIDFARAMARGGTANAQSKQTEVMKSSFPVAQTASSSSVHGVAGFNGPGDLVLHGSCVEVPLSGSTTVGAPIRTDDIRLFPSVRRAMAEVAAANTASADQVDAVEMMLDDVESMKSSLGGVLDMPGAAHAATFQNVPGKSQWYARLEVQPKSSPWQSLIAFDTQAMAISPGLQATGHWPQMTMRSASNKQEWMRKTYAPAVTSEPPVVAPPQLTEENDYAPWRASVAQALADTINAPQTPAKAIHPTVIQVMDRRKDAQPTLIGKTAGRGGSDGAAWWIDITDVAAMNELLLAVQGAKVILPNVDNLVEVPGQRWNRPWSPHVVLYGTGRSFKAGFDGRFRQDGYLKTRQSGETVIGLSVGSYARVHGKDIIDKPNELFSIPGLPADVRALVHESVLLDTESTSVMAQLSLGRTATKETLATAQQRMKSAVRALWLARDQKTVAARKPKLSAVATSGTYPSDVAMSPWQDPRDPLFVDANYSHPFSSLATDWVLDQDRVEMRAAGAAATNPAPGAPPAGQVEVIEERTRVTATVANVLESTLVTKKSADVTGALVTAQKPPKGVTADTFKQMDMISAPLTALDSTLLARGRRERTGALRLNRLQLVDMFGIAREWKSGTDPVSADGNAALTYWTELAPRLPYWARLLVRLQRADDPDQEANPVAHPVCGILVPDFIEHALEVFDGHGQAIGQLTTDRPRFGGGLDTPGASLQVSFTLHPWVAAGLNQPPGANPIDAVQNGILRSLLASLLAQGAEMPANALTTDWYETGMSAMLRSIDTVRATLDPTQKTDDKRIKLLGEPILVLAARLTYQATSSTNPSQLAQDPPLLTGSPALPVLQVRIGDATRPDDGTLGCFKTGATPADGRFAPVTKEAAEKAIVNGLAMGVPYFAHSGLAVTHPFVKDQESLFHVEADHHTDIVILADPRGGLYATCGALPRKKITMPREFIQASLAHLEPTFRVGPVFTTKAMGALKALAPPPQIDGFEAEFVYRSAGSGGDPDTFPEAAVPPVPPVGELPRDRAVLSDGWMRVFKPEET